MEGRLLTGTPRALHGDLARVTGSTGLSVIPTRPRPRPWSEFAEIPRWAGLLLAPRKACVGAHSGISS